MVITLQNWGRHEPGCWSRRGNEPPQISPKGGAAPCPGKMKVASVSRLSSQGRWDEQNLQGTEHEVRPRTNCRPRYDTTRSFVRRDAMLVLYAVVYWCTGSFISPGTGRWTMSSCATNSHPHPHPYAYSYNGKQGISENKTP